MSQSTKQIDTITLNTDQPTQLPFTALYTWVIWQFPRTTPQNGQLYGAVYPPTTEARWLPALIEPKEKRLAIYAHLDGQFETPEAAADAVADYLLTNDR